MPQRAVISAVEHDLTITQVEQLWFGVGESGEAIKGGFWKSGGFCLDTVLT